MGGDTIDLSALDASASVGGNQAFAFIGTARFGAAGQIRFRQAGGETVIEANTNSATGIIGFERRLSKCQTLTAGDFML